MAKSQTKSKTESKYIVTRITRAGTYASIELPSLAAAQSLKAAVSEGQYAAIERTFGGGTFEVSYGHGEVKIYQLVE